MKATKTLFGIFTVTAALMASAQAQVPFTNNLAAYYPFDGSANDASGNGNNGTLSGAATFGLDRFGSTNACLSLPGGEGGGSGVNIPSLSNGPLGPLTYSAWFWLSNYPPAGGVAFMPLMGRMVCGNTQCGAICVNSQTGVNTNQLTYFTGGTSYSMKQAVPLQTWCQVVFTVDGSGNPNFYLDGTNVPSSGSAPASQPIDFWIGAASANGCGPGGDFYVWNGLIDDVRVYNTNLSSNEVLQLYQYESACIPYSATASATVDNKFVVAATITDGGCGYTNPPAVLILGGGGSGATGTAIVNNGMVTGITITDAGSNYTGIPTIYIYAPFAITAQPQSVITNAHSSASFNVTATGTEPLNYQWSLNNTNILGATNSTLTISNLVQTNLGTYAVVVTNVFGSLTSSNAVLSMYPILVIPFGGLDTDWGYTNILSVAAWGSGPLSYQWYQNGNVIDGATNQTLDFTGIQFSNAGLYSVVVSNPFGSATNTPEQVVVNPSGISLGLCPAVTITGVVGYTYAIQSTTNLSNTNSWVTLTNLTLTQPVQLWVDTNTDASLPANPLRFYQVLPGQ